MNSMMSQLHSIEDLKIEENCYEESYIEIERLEEAFQSLDISNSDQKETILFEILKQKCKAGILCPSKEEKNKSCMHIRREMQDIMGEFAYKYCFIVISGADNNQCWSICPYIHNKEKYFKISHQLYIYIAYQIPRDVIFVEKPTEQENKETCSTQNTKENSKLAKFVKDKVIAPQKAIKPLQESNQEKKRTSVTNKGYQKTTTSYLQRQRKADHQKELKLIKQYNIENNPNTNKIPSKDKIQSIAKQYKNYIGKEIPTKPFNCKQYVDAIQTAFINQGIQPRLILVKKIPVGDHFWDYECENEGTLHSWDIIKEKGIAVCL